MRGTMLVTRPRHDDTTYYLFHWAQEIIQLAKKKGVKIFDLAKERANRKELESVAAKMQPSFIFLNGHGNANCVAGCDNEPLIKAGDNEKILERKSVYALSCSSAKKLGPASVKAGAKVYMGYEDDFMFMYEPDKLSKPLEDKTAKLFLGPSNQLVISFLKGHTAGEARERSQNYFMENIQKLISSDSSDSDMAQYLLWDKMHQVCLGDKDTVI